MTTESQTIFEKGRQTAIVNTDVNGIRHILIPKDCDLKSMEYLMPTPARIKAHPEFADETGFAEYIAEFKEDGSRIFVDEDARRFSVVFDCHHKGKPAWGDHSASMVLALSHEWRRFCQLDGKVMSNVDFAEFIEDHIAYISGNDMSGSDLLTLAQNFKVEFKGELNTESTLHSGLRKLVIRDDHVVSGKCGDKELSFPERLKLNLRVFHGGAAYPIEVYVRYRASKEGVKFWIKIPDIQGIQEEAFRIVTKNVANKTGLPVLLGKYVGQSHK